MPYSRRSLEKAAGDIAAIFPLDENADILAIQEKIRAVLGDQGITYVDPQDFHITAVIANGINLIPLVETLSWGFAAIALIADYVDVFETPNGFAIHIGVRWNSDLDWVQRSIFYSMVGEGGMVSGFSIPDYYRPHITIAYSQFEIAPFEIEPFAVLIDKIEISDENNQPIIEVEMKGTDEAMKMKSMHLEVVQKSVHFNDEGDLIIPLVGVPYKGPALDGRGDIAGEFFHKGTDIGDAKEVLVFWDHGRDPNYMKRELKSIGLSEDEITELGDDFGFGNRDIGVAQKAEANEDGIMFNVILSRRTKYLAAMKRAADAGLISGSGEYRSIEYDADVPGKVDYAPLVGMALTPSPFNIEARTLKAVELEKEKMAKKATEEKPVETSEENKEIKTPVTEIPAKTSITEAIKAKAAEIAAEDEVEAETEEKPEETIVVNAAQFKALVEKVDSQEKKIEALILKGFEDLTTDFATAMPEFANIVAASLHKSIVAAVKKSKYELDFDLEAPESKTVAPSKKKATPIHGQAAAIANWPGSN